jgi:hypothetical protein
MTSMKIDWSGVPDSCKGVKFPCLGDRAFAEKMLRLIGDANEFLPDDCHIKETGDGYRYLCFNRPSKFKVPV